MEAIKCILNNVMLKVKDANRVARCHDIISELFDKGHINIKQRDLLLDEYLAPTVFVIMMNGTVLITYRTLELAKAHVEEINVFPLKWPEYKEDEPLVPTDEQGMLADGYKVIGTKIHYQLT